MPWSCGNNRLRKSFSRSCGKTIINNIIICRKIPSSDKFCIGFSNSDIFRIPTGKSPDSILNRISNTIKNFLNRLNIVSHHFVCNISQSFKCWKRFISRSRNEFMRNFMFIWSKSPFSNESFSFRIYQNRRIIIPRKCPNSVLSLINKSI